MARHEFEHNIKPAVTWGGEPAPTNPRIEKVGVESSVDGAQAERAGGILGGTMRPRVGIERYPGLLLRRSTQF